MVWILVGVVLIGGTFVGVFSASGETWQALNLAGLASVGYVLALVFFTTAKALPSKKRRWIILAVILGILITGERWRIMYMQSQFQAETLMKIRGIIDEGVLEAFMMGPATKILQGYHLKPPSSPETLKEVSARLYPPRFFNPAVFDTVEDLGRIYLAVSSDSMVVLVGKSDYSLGHDAGFRNYDGSQGWLQRKVTITERGIRTEIEN